MLSRWCFCLAFGFFAVLPAAAEEWPRWRGPKGDGISRETGLADKWPADGPARKWTAKTGLGYSSPIAMDGKIYLFSQTDQNSVLTAFDADTGKVVWSQSESGGYPKNDFEGARATPAIDGSHIYTYGGAGDLTCRDLNDGKETWRMNVLKATQTQLLQWGQATSPLVDEHAVYVQAGAGGSIAIAVDKSTGNILWQSQERGQAGYAAPIIAQLGGRSELIIFSGSSVVGMDPATGKTLWSVLWQTSYNVNACTPIAEGDRIFVSNGYGHGSAQFVINGDAAREAWRASEVACKIPSAVLDQGYLYCNSEDHSGTLKCLNWDTGKLAWEANGGRDIKLGFGGTFVRNADKLYTLSQNGRISLMKATPQKIELISQAQAFPENFDKAWSTPLIYHGKLYVKGESQLACYDISSSTASK